MSKTQQHLFCAGTAIALVMGLWAAPALAQATAPRAEAVPGAATSPNPADDDSDAASEVVVTGTLIRGVAPVGASAVTVNEKEIQKLGVTDSTQLLARIPQLATFGQLSTPIGTSAGSVFPPQIRGLPTLVLFDGQRIPPLGNLQSDPNVNTIPPSLVERVEVIPGGGSALYGSEAVGGVINFIPRRRLEGFIASAHVGFADSYRTRGGDIAFGQPWSTGSLILAYSYDHHSNLAGRDRDWFTMDPLHQGGAALTNICEPGNVTIGTASYRLPSLTPGTNLCDRNDYEDIYPRYTRHAGYLSFRQQLGHALRFDLTASVARENFTSQGVQFFSTTNLDASGTITNTNPYFRPVGTETSQSFTELLATVGAPYDLGRNWATYTTYGITPKLTLNLGGSWQAAASFNYGESTIHNLTNRINGAALTAALAGTTTATAFNPYAPELTNSTVLRNILNTAFDTAEGHQYLTQSRLVVDGPLFALPGGEVKVAAGYEHQTYKLKFGSNPLSTRNAPFTFNSRSRKIDSLFGELSVPIVGEANAFSGVRRLSLSLAGRYDKFSDGFDTFNPKVGFTYEPTLGLSFFGNWGKSFRAPDLAYRNGITSVAVVPAFISILPEDALLYGNRLLFILVGANPSTIKPETSKAWSLGFTATPTAAPGLKLTGTYFNIKFKDKIDYPPNFPATDASRPFYLLHPTLAQLQAATAGFPFNTPVNLASLYASPSTEPYAVLRFYPQNVADIKESGFDFDLSYDRAVSFGSVHARVGGLYYFTYDTAPLGLPFSSNLTDGQPRINFQTELGMEAGPIEAQVRVDRRGSAPVRNASIKKIRSYTTVNLFAGYKLGRIGPLSTAELTVNVDNILNENPPPRFGSASGAAFTSIGRMVTVGIKTTF